MSQSSLRPIECLIKPRTVRASCWSSQQPLGFYWLRGPSLYSFLHRLFPSSEPQPCLQRFKPCCLASELHILSDNHYLLTFIQPNFAQCPSHFFFPFSYKEWSFLVVNRMLMYHKSSPWFVHYILSLLKSCDSWGTKK